MARAPAGGPGPGRPKDAAVLCGPRGAPQHGAAAAGAGRPRGRGRRCGPHPGARGCGGGAGRAAEGAAAGAARRGGVWLGGGRSQRLGPAAPGARGGVARRGGGRGQARAMAPCVCVWRAPGRCSCACAAYDDGIGEPMYTATTDVGHDNSWWMAVSCALLPQAANNGHVAAVRALVVEGGCDVGVVNACASAAQGWTPLHCCAIKGHVDAARALLELGAQVGFCSRRWLLVGPCRRSKSHPP